MGVIESFVEFYTHYRARRIIWFIRNPSCQCVRPCTILVGGCPQDGDGVSSQEFNIGQFHLRFLNESTSKRCRDVGFLDIIFLKRNLNKWYECPSSYKDELEFDQGSAVLNIEY